MKQNEKRISLSLEMPTIGLRNFIEKALQNDNFFESAVMNPLEVLKENGVRLNVKLLTPSDLATFFGSLAGAKEMIKNRKIKEIKFENVFGQVAEVRGSTIRAEKNIGIWTKFDRDAVTDKEMCSSVRISFESLQEKLQDILTDLSKDNKISITRDVQLDKHFTIRTEIAFEGKTEQYRSTDTGVTFHFDHNQGIGSSRSSSIDTYKTQSFSGLGQLSTSLIEDLLNGPLISPMELVKIAAQINTYVNITGQM